MDGVLNEQTVCNAKWHLKITARPALSQTMEVAGDQFQSLNSWPKLDYSPWIWPAIQSTASEKFSNTIVGGGSIETLGKYFPVRTRIPRIPIFMPPAISSVISWKGILFRQLEGKESELDWTYISDHNTVLWFYTIRNCWSEERLIGFAHKNCLDTSRVLESFGEKSRTDGQSIFPLVILCSWIAIRRGWVLRILKARLRFS